jgi:hypothetical protein
MMARPTSDPKPHQIQLRCNSEFIHQLDEWRAKQRPIPSRSEAIRQTALIGMKVKERPKPK